MVYQDQLAESFRTICGCRRPVEIDLSTSIWLLQVMPRPQMHDKGQEDVQHR